MNRTITALLAVLMLPGCLYQGAATSVDAEELRGEPGVTQVPVPVVLQTGDKDCGAAALASVLRFWGDKVTPESIRHATKIPSDEPIAAGVLQEYLTLRGYENFLIAGTLADLRHELSSGRPVLVGMLKPYVGKQWTAHYEVVTGISSDRVFTMNPANGLEQYPTAGFMREWQAAKHVALLIAPAPAVSEAKGAGS